MKLFFCAATDPDDVTNNLDLFVRAHDVATAIAYWLVYYADYDGVCPDVREVPPITDQSGPVPWDQIPVLI